MRRHGVGDVPDGVARRPRPPAQVHILEIHEEAGVKIRPTPPLRRSRDRQRAAGHERHRGGLVKRAAVGRAPPPVVGGGEREAERAARVLHRRAIRVEQLAPGDGRPVPRVVGQPPRQRRQPVGPGPHIGIEHGQEVAPRRLPAQVGPAAEAQVGRAAISRTCGNCACMTAALPSVEALSTTMISTSPGYSSACKAARQPGSWSAVL